MALRSSKKHVFGPFGGLIASVTSVETVQNDRVTKANILCLLNYQTLRKPVVLRAPCFVLRASSSKFATPYLGMLEWSDQKVIFSNWSQIVQILRLAFSEFDSDHPSRP